MIVVDASVAVPAVADRGASGQVARSRLRSEVLVAPHLLLVEIASAVRGLRLGGRLDDKDARRAIDRAVALPIDLAPHGPLLRRCHDLRANLTSYDAMYVALAERRGCVLVTADARMASAPGPRCRIELIGA